MEQLYGHPISQSACAVAWLCQLNDHAIEYKLVQLMEGETHSEAFQTQLNPMGKIPVLKDREFVLTESHAIMFYLADKHGWSQWYPMDRKIRARIHEYMHWHHNNARLSSQIFVNTIHANLGRATPVMEAQLKKKEKTINGILAMLEFWMRHGNAYLMTHAEPSIADLSCYNEIVPLEVMGLLPHVHTTFPKVAIWLKRMKSLPHHDEQLAPMMAFLNQYKLTPSSKM